MCANSVEHLKLKVSGRGAFGPRPWREGGLAQAARVHVPFMGISLAWRRGSSPLGWVILTTNGLFLLPGSTLIKPFSDYILASKGYSPTERKHANQMAQISGYLSTFLSNC